MIKRRVLTLLFFVIKIIFISQPNNEEFMFVEITKKKLVMAFVFNFLIFVLEVVGLVLSIQRHGMNVFCYYTENSNYFAGIVSAVFCVVVLLIKR